MRGFRSVPASALLGLLIVACQGQISGQPLPGSGGNTGTGQAGATGNTAGGANTPSGSTLPLPSNLAAPQACTNNAPGPRKLWRLTAAQLTNSIRSIFDNTSSAAPVATVFSDPSVLGFSIDANALLVQGLNASQLEDNAEAVASWAASANQLAPFAGCAAMTNGPDLACAKEFVQAFGKRAFRSKLDDADARVASYSKLFMSGSSNSDGAQVVISAMLQSPYFLYRSELGTASGNGTFTLSAYEVATELAYTLTGTTPDDALLKAADTANTPAQIADMVEQQAARLISAGDTNTQAVMGFMDGWLGLSRVYTTAHANTVQLTDGLKLDMWNEAQSLIMEAFNSKGTFASILTADHSFLNQELASFYGISSSGLGDGLTSVKYAGLTRDPGLLATGAIVSGYARPDADSPTQRGHMVRTRLLCQYIQPPPPGLDTTFKPSNATETTRDHFINEHEQGACKSCHMQMDWIGFAFESYDGWGRYRPMDNGLPTNSAAVIYGDPQGKDDNVTGLSGANSLPAFLAQSDDVTRCMERYWAYYTYGSSSWAQDACTYDAVYEQAKSQGFTLQSTLSALIHAPSFTTRVQDQ
jgi:hypothetical protein